MKIGYAQVSFAPDFEGALENCSAASGHVDEMVVVEDGSFTDAMKKRLEDLGVKVVFKEWNDDFPAFRNASLEALRQLGCDWCIISDCDEHHSPELWNDLKSKIVPALEKGGFNQSGVRCFDDFEVVDWLPFDQLDRLKELPGGSAHETTWYKNLIFRLYPDVNYSGQGGTIGIGGAKRLTYKCPDCGEMETVYK